MTPWHDTDNLRTDVDGTMYVWDDGRFKRLGDIEFSLGEADALGFANEYDEHWDLWNGRSDFRGQVLADYRTQQGF